MHGSLGPLQGEALSGTMTITLVKTETGARLQLEYVVGGYMRMKGEAIALAVEDMLGQQLAKLAAMLDAAPQLEPAAPG